MHKCHFNHQRTHQTLYILNRNHPSYLSRKDHTRQDHVLCPDQPDHLFWLIKRIIKKINAESAVFTLSCFQVFFLQVLAHNNLIGRIIGKSGATIKKIMEDTDSKITVSSISDISSFNPERVITIKGAIPDISRAEAEVTGSHHQFLFLSKRFLRVHVGFKVSSKLRAAYETDLQVQKSLNWPKQWLTWALQAMAPQSVMFPGLHPAAMMATVDINERHNRH